MKGASKRSEFPALDVSLYALRNTSCFIDKISMRLSLAQRSKSLALSSVFHRETPLQTMNRNSPFFFCLFCFCRSVN